MIKENNGKGARTKLLKTAFVETLYECWKYRNETCFRGNINNPKIGQHIIDSLIYMNWVNPKLREHIVKLMIV